MKEIWLSTFTLITAHTGSCLQLVLKVHFYWCRTTVKTDSLGDWWVLPTFCCQLIPCRRLIALYRRNCTKSEQNYKQTSRNHSFVHSKAQMVLFIWMPCPRNLCKTALFIATSATKRDFAAMIGLGPMKKQEIWAQMPMYFAATSHHHTPWQGGGWHFP